MQALCMRCRTLLGENEGCDVCDAEALSLASQRDAILAQVWRQPERSATRSHGFPVSLGIAAVLGAAEAGVTGAAIAAGVTAGAYGVFSLLFRSEPTARPRGARARPMPPMRSATGIVTEVKRDQGAGAFLEGAATVLTYSINSNEHVTLRRGACHTLTITCADGRRVLVPAGRCRLEARRAEQREVNVVEAARLLLDLEPRDDFEVTAFPFDRAHQIDAHVGDEVELLGNLSRIPREDGHYRDSANAGSRFVSTPWFRLLSRAGSSQR